MALVQPFLVKFYRTGAAKSVDQPLDTLTTKPRYGLAEPFLIPFYGQSEAHSANQPLAAITTQNHFGLVEPVQNGFKLDILFRMLQPHELAAAMSFENYTFVGTKAQQVKQIGNAVPVLLATALCHEILKTCI